MTIIRRPVGGVVRVRTSDIRQLAHRRIGPGSAACDEYAENVQRARGGDVESIRYLETLGLSGTEVNGFKIYTREDLERWERSFLAPKASRSIGAGNRLRKEAADPNRTAYYRDLGRIVHSKAFRALIGKTQVFPFPKSPLVHTRAFHSIKVAQLGESIGKSLGLNVDLIWAIGLGHDLGHSPFGHAGEEALDAISREAPGEGSPFRHNIQSVRILMDLEEYFPKVKGMNLTLEVLDGILHHWGESNEYALAPREDPAYRGYLALVREEGSQLDMFRGEGEIGELPAIGEKEIRRLLSPENDKDCPLTYEGCVIRLADKIAYLPVDLEDALSHGFLVESKLSVPERKKLNEIRRVLGQNPSQMFNTMVTSVIETSRRAGMIAMSEEVGRAMNMLKEFVYQNICFSSDRREVDDKIPYVFRQIFDYLTKVEGSTVREAIDRIAGMTDRQAAGLFKRITVPRSII